MAQIVFGGYMDLLDQRKLLTLTISEDVECVLTTFKTKMAIQKVNNGRGREGGR